MRLTRRIFYSHLKLTLFALTLLGFVACENEVTVPNSVFWKDSPVISAASGSVAIEVSGPTGVKWNARIIEGAEWCSFNSTNYTLSGISGFITNDGNMLQVYCKKNTSPSERKALILFQFQGEDAQTFTLTQTPFFSTYVETPTYREDENFQYVTHYTSLNNKTIRNFSLCFDLSKRAALWVAYPLHACYRGSVKRTNEWGFDPVINRLRQAECVKRSYSGPYDRGHQIASADRLATRHMNVQTFFMTNMTPQLDRLNQDMWANLENKVRSFICSDTLYVVTGAFFDESSTLATTDGAGNIAPLPTHYYKVLLRTISGSTGKTIAQCSPNELKTIGFWVEHRSYGNIEAPSSTFVSVSEIEEKTGFTFFPQVAESVKQQHNPSQWGL